MIKCSTEGREGEENLLLRYLKLAPHPKKKKIGELRFAFCGVEFRLECRDPPFALHHRGDLSSLKESCGDEKDLLGCNASY